jgi:hypothetical protein
MTTFLFLRLTPTPESCRERQTHETVGRGEPRIRPFVPIPVPVPPGCPGLPDRDTDTDRDTLASFCAHLREAP